MRRVHNTLVFGEGRERWSIPDPTSEQTGDLLHRCRYGGELTRPERYQLCDLAGAYVFLTTYALGVEHCIQKLRQICRGLREESAE